MYKLEYDCSFHYTVDLGLNDIEHMRDVDGSPLIKFCDNVQEAANFILVREQDLNSHVTTGYYYMTVLNWRKIDD